MSWSTFFDIGPHFPHVPTASVLPYTVCDVGDLNGGASCRNTQDDRMPHTWGRLSSVFAMRTRTGLSVGRGGQVRSVGSVWATECRVGKLRTFLEYTHSLNWYMPAGMIPPLGVIATGAETLFGLLLLVGWHTRATALLSGLLLLSFGVAMTLALGVKAPLNFAVFTGGEGPASRKLRKLPTQRG